MIKFVTGIGSRTVDEKGKSRVIEIAKLLNKAGYSLRSGGADGCDTLFEENMDNKDIFLPWPGFNNRKTVYLPITNQAMEIASTVHPYWNKLKQSVKKLHGRNVYQVLGYTLSRPSNFVVCWTPDGCKSEKTSTRNTGGTRTAIVLADRNHIPIYNLKNDEDYIKIKELLNTEIAKAND